MFLKLLIISLILVGFSFLGLMLNILVRKRGKFPEHRVGHNRDMHRLGISCVKHDEIRCHNEVMGNSEGCTACR
jgi:hypothetical protein